MARRHRHHDEAENNERWLVSYADFITLLFAFFVVMYAVSSVNEGKYRVLSESLNSVFAATPKSEKPIQVGEPRRDMTVVEEKPATLDASVHADGDATTPGETTRGAGSTGDEGDDDSNQDGASAKVAKEIAISLYSYIQEGLVAITEGGGRIEIEMNNRMLFGSGDARLASEALGPLRQVAESLKRVPSHIQIEGHTDNVPIATAAFPSNWELSAARAAAVVHYLGRAGVEPWRMAAVGLGEYRPIVENSDAKGRATNRRVKIVVLTGARPPETQFVDEDIPWAEGPALQRR